MEQISRTATDARQGSEEHVVRYVLGGSLALAVVGMAAVLALSGCQTPPASGSQSTATNTPRQDPPAPRNSMPMPSMGGGGGY